MSWDTSRDLSADLVQAVLAVVEAIPPGKVMSYGDVADAVGPHAELDEDGGAYAGRVVGLVMARCGEAVPWWRVIRASGQPPRGHEANAWPHYLAEATPTIGTADDYRIDMKLARYVPGAAVQTSLF